MSGGAGRQAVRIAVWGGTVAIAGTLGTLYWRAGRAQTLEIALRSAADLAFLGVWDAAAAKADEALRLAPESAWAHVWLAVGHAGAAPAAGADAPARRDAAEAAFTRALALAPADAELAAAVGDWAVRLGCLGPAPAASDRLVALGAGAEAAWIRGRWRLAEAVRRGDTDPRGAARADLSQAATLAPDVRTAARAGKLGVALEDAVVAAAAAARIRDLDATDPQRHVFEGVAAASGGDATAARAAYESGLASLDAREAARPHASTAELEERVVLRADLRWRRGSLRLAAGDAAGGAEDLAAAWTGTREIAPLSREATRALPQLAQDAARALLAAGRGADADRALAEAWNRGGPGDRDRLRAEAKAGAWDALPDGASRGLLDLPPTRPRG